MDIAIKAQDPANELQVGYKQAGGSAFLIPLANHPSLTAIQTYLRGILPPSAAFNDPATFHCTLLVMPQGDGFTPSPDLLTYLPAFSISASWMTCFDTPDGWAIVVGVNLERPLQYLQSGLFYQALYEGVELSPFSWNARYTPHITLAYVPKDQLRVDYFDGFMPMPFAASVFEIAYSDAARNMTLYSLGVPPEPEMDDESTDEMESVTDEALEEMLEALTDEESDDMEEADTVETKGILQRLKAWFTRQESDPLFDAPSGFKMLGSNRWIAWYTNGYQDRDKEWCATKAIESDIDLMWQKGQFPELWWWHLGDVRKDWKPTKHGQADWVGMVGRFAVATGTFDNTPFARAMKAYYKKHAKQQGVSHGFFYNPTQFKNGVYHEFHTFEISVLPADKASNPYAPFGLIEGENNKMATQEQFNALAGMIGEELAKSVMTSGEKATQVLDQEVAFKAAVEPEKEMTDEKADDKAESETTKAIKSLEAAIVAQTVAFKAMIEAMRTPAQPAAEEKKDVKPRDQEAPMLTDERKALILADYVANQQKQITERSNDPAQNLLSMFNPQSN